MSTFNGIVAEFPDIRIDYFRGSNNESRPPLAYFLSHVHSDHLVGLESCRSPFIYCSPGTRDILLRLEKYPHRMNFAKGILETRKQTYRHLKNLLKAIPLETPTVIELSPSSNVRVTLFDANHCVGAVMFLIEGDGKAILYTGDIRSEAWWVNSLIRQPILVPYVSNAGSKPISRLDCLYLDTTFVVTGKEDPYAAFPSKADGLQELLRKVSKYPKNTLFYLEAWTFGYEDVWQSLSMFLASRIHVDDYKFGLYRAVANGLEPKDAEATKLMGFYCGNHFQQGSLSANSGECRIHSCERCTGCDIWSQDFVRITPIVSRYNGVEIAELGAGGGQGDLNQRHELEVYDAEVVGKLMALCASKLHRQPQLLSGVLEMLSSTINERMQSIKLDGFSLTAEDEVLSRDEPFDVATLEDFPLDKLVPALVQVMARNKQKKGEQGDAEKRQPVKDATGRTDGLPKSITFPYSRHSSYNELCNLVEAFKPSNIFPCTVEELVWTPASSMSFLFGHAYDAPPSFSHDHMMLKKRNIQRENPDAGIIQSSPRSSSSDYATPNASTAHINEDHDTVRDILTMPTLDFDDQIDASMPEVDMPPSKRKRKTPQGQGNKLFAGEIDDSCPKGTVRHSSVRQAVADGLDEIMDEAFADRRGQQSSSTHKRRHLLHGRALELMPSKSRLAHEAARGQQRSEQLRDTGIPSFSSTGRAAEHGSARKSHQTRTSDRPTSLVESSPDQDRLNFRQHVYEAVRNNKAEAWSHVGLVSVSGHQCKEEEL